MENLLRLLESNLSEIQLISKFQKQGAEMSKILFNFLGVLFIILLFCILPLSIAAQKRKFTRPTIIAVSLIETPFYHVKMAFEDDDYFFAFRHYGRAEHTPGFFVYGKKQKKWLEIKKHSTEYAKLGHYNGLDGFITEENPNDEKMAKVKITPRRKTVPILAVTWDYRPLANVSYADIPLRTSGSIVFPDKISYDNINNAYLLFFGSSYNIEDMLTQFWMRKADLDEAFK